MNLSRNKTGAHMIDILFTLALFCVFAAASLMVVLIGAGVYRSTVSKMDANFEVSTSLSYVTTKIRQFDAAGGLRTGELDGLPAIVLEEDIGGVPYQTWIYHYDGALWELFVSAEDSATARPENGQALMAVHDFSAELLDGNLLSLRSADGDGNSLTQLVGLRSAEGGI